jgi:PKD repeat protein
MRFRFCLALLALMLPASAFAQSTQVSTATTHVQARAAAAGIVAPEVVVTDAYTSRRSGTTHVYLRQQIAGLEVVGTETTVNVDRSGRVFHAVGAGRFVPATDALRRAPAPGLSAVDAAQALGRTHGLNGSFTVLEMKGGTDQAVTLSDGGVALEPVPARLVWHRGEDGALRMAWEVGIYQRDAQHYWHGYVDAETGAVLEEMDLVVHENHGSDGHAAEGRASSLAPIETNSFGGPLASLAPYATAGSLAGPEYKVYEYPVEAPYYSSPAAPSDGRTVAVNPADPLASPFGWHDTNGVAGAEYTRTRGNNVHAYTDLNADNLPDSGSDPEGGPELRFSFSLNLAQAPSTYRPAAVTNLFYWSNIVHDILYQYGFDEASGNFQVNNYGRGGAGGDDVRAEAQDGSGTNNANFFTPADGSRPRMQMYVGTSPNPDVDGDFDNGVIVHEYGHGISNRLTGGPSNVSCLGNGEQAGEGWSDYYGLMLTMKPGASRTQSRGIGNYLFGYGPNGGGIRLAPYNTNFSVNGYTYGDTRNMTAVHQIGFVWATILWEVTWDMIDAHGFDPDFYNAAGSAGNIKMIQLVTEGLRLQSCSPGFVDARDAILAADQALYGGAHTSLLQAAFARRGLGYSASQGSSSRTRDNAEAFDLWPSGGGNVAPTAAFASSCSGLACSFTDASTDSDGSIVGRSWTFGDGGTSTATNPSYTYAAAGSYTVSLTVTDDDGATGSTQQTVTVSDGGSGGAIVLEASPRTTGPWANADLTWTPADGGNVDVVRGTSVIATVPDNGSYSDRIGRNVSGSYTYKVCEPGTNVCSNEATVSFLDGATASATGGEALETAILGAYPNPTTRASSTTIRFSLAERADIDLAVYNSIGQRVAVLTTGSREAGYHTAAFDTLDLPSGVYLYRLVAGTEVLTGRLMLVK